MHYPGSRNRPPQDIGTAKKLCRYAIARLQRKSAFHCRTIREITTSCTCNKNGYVYVCRYIKREKLKKESEKEAIWISNKTSDAEYNTVSGEHNNFNILLKTASGAEEPSLETSDVNLRQSNGQRSGNDVIDDRVFRTFSAIIYRDEIHKTGHSVHSSL